MEERIPVPFLKHAADILGDTDRGLSGAVIVQATNAYAVEFDVDLPHPVYPFDAPNKRTALFENLMEFLPSQQYRILKDLCDHQSFPPKRSAERKDLFFKLVTRYRHLDEGEETQEVNQPLVEETRHWLGEYPAALELYSAALEKYDHGSFHRNLLDDLRLSLESLLKSIFENTKSLEKQLPSIGGHIKNGGGSPELANMFAKLLQNYSKYQNSYVKHNDAVIEEEIEFVIELTSSFMKHIIRLSR